MPDWRGTVIELMMLKDPELMDQNAIVAIPQLYHIWVDKHPEDFPKGPSTSIHDLSAIKMPTNSDAPR